MDDIGAVLRACGNPLHAILRRPFEMSATMSYQKYTCSECSGREHPCVSYTDNHDDTTVPPLCIWSIGFNCQIAKWKRCAQKNKERRKTVRAKRPVQQRKQYICPDCKGPLWPKGVTGLYRCISDVSCGWQGKHPAIA